jgi:D-alanine--D-alanine ligase
MRIAVTHNLRITSSIEEAEFDAPETIDAIVRVFEKAGHAVERVDVTGPASRLVARLEAFAPDIIFNTAEGRRGKMRRAFYPALFEELGMPATGSDAYALCVTLDKTLTKKVLAGHGIPSPRGRLMTRESFRAGGLDELHYPVIAKPNFEGSSKGITQKSVALDATELGPIIDDLLFSYPEGVLVESYVPGVDVRVCRIDGATRLSPVELAVDADYPRRFDVLDYALKHEESDHVKCVVPANVPSRVLERLTDLGARAYEALGLRDAASLDFRVGRDGEVYFLSATALPSFEKGAAILSASAMAGLDYDATILAILRAAASRTGLLPLLEGAKPKPRARRTSLRVGLAFNMKRIESADGDDREAEYDSPETIDALGKAIESHGHVVIPLEATPDLPRTLLTSGVDIVFNIAEGISGRNREAQVPNLCELLGIPYTGSDSATLSICLDKALSKRMLRDVATPQAQLLLTGREKLKPLKYPVIIKPNAEGTSKGISSKSVKDDEAGVREVAREIIERYGQPALVEEYIVGREFTVGLLGEKRPRVLPPMEIVFLKASDRSVYDYECKQDWERHVRYEVPATLSKEELRAIERASRSTFMSLGCRDVARVDLRLALDGTVYVIEVNPLPGLTPDYSDLCLIANGAKIAYRSLIGDILSGAIKRWREKQGDTREPSELGGTAGSTAELSGTTPAPTQVTN